MLYYLFFGLVLGLTAGLSPGPLLTLVISETLRHGFFAGLKIAIAPIITDAPIVILTLFVATQFSDVDDVLGIISLVGSGYVFYLSYDGIKQKEVEMPQELPRYRSLTKGVFANALSPHPYLFWLSVGAPTVANSMDVSVFAPVLFVSFFYLFLIGSKIILAALVARSKSLLSGRVYVYVMKFLALVLGIFGVALFIDGLILLGVYGN